MNQPNMPQFESDEALRFAAVRERALDNTHARPNSWLSTVMDCPVQVSDLQYPVGADDAALRRQRLAP